MFAYVKLDKVNRLNPSLAGTTSPTSFEDYDEAEAKAS